MSNSRSSNHFMYLTRHRETYRDYCTGCANYRVLHQHPVGEHYCRSCTSTINQALRKKHLDLTQVAQASQETKSEIQDFIDTLLLELEKETPRKKVTRKNKGVR
jgi:ribosomal protein S27E